MLIKLRNYQDDAWVVVNTDYIISIERISGGSIVTTAAKSDYKDPKSSRVVEHDKVNQRVFTCEELEDIIELVSKFTPIEGTGVQQAIGKKSKQECKGKFKT